MLKIALIAVFVCAQLYAVQGCGPKPKPKPGPRPPPPPPPCKFKKCMQKFKAFHPLPKMGECAVQRQVGVNKIDVVHLNPVHEKKKNRHWRCPRDIVCKPDRIRTWCQCQIISYKKEYENWRVVEDDGFCKTKARRRKEAGRRAHHGFKGECDKINLKNKMNAGEQTKTECQDVVEA